MPDPAAADFGTPSPTPGSSSSDADYAAFFAAKAPTPRPPPVQGSTWDAILSSAKTEAGRLLNAFGQGPKDLWGAAPTGLDPQTEASLRKVESDYFPGHEAFFKGVNEAVIRPAALAAETFARGLQTAPAAMEGVLGQAGEDISGAIAPGYEAQGNIPRTPGEALVSAFGTASEVGGAVLRGEVPELGIFAYGGLEHAALDASRARGIGVIGEGEAGFYGAEPVSPENIVARTDAAHEAGVEPTPPEPPAPDIHALARRIDPETFEQYDALALEREQHRATIAALGEERVNSPEALEAQGQIDTILGRVNNVLSRLTNVARERLQAAQDRLDTILTADSPEMTAARNALMEADFAMRELAPDVSEAYRQAADMMPAKPTETAAEAPQKPVEAAREEKPDEEAMAEERPPAGTQGALALERTPEEEAGARAVVAAGLSPEGRAEVAPAEVIGKRKARETGERATQAEAGPAATPQDELALAPAAREPVEGVEGGIPADVWRQAVADVEEHRSPRPPRTTIVQRIKELGGMRVREPDGSPTPGPDVQGALEDFKRKPPGMINNAKGMSPEQMHEALKDEGWFGHGNVSEDALVDALQKQARGEDVFHPESGLAEAHARRAQLDREMAEAGVQPKDNPAVAALKLAEYRQVREETFRKMEILRDEADALGIPQGPETTYDELLADVVERRAIEGELSGHELDAYEDDIDAGLTKSDLDELDRLAAERTGEEQGEGAGAFHVSGRGQPAGGEAGSRGQLPAGAAGGGEGARAAGAGSAHPVAETGERVVRGLARSTEERALENGLGEAFGDQPEYRRMNKADQAARVIELMDRDYETAKEIALGLKNAPHGILPESVFEGVRQRAITEGDWDTARQLATHSRLTEEATTMGRRIGMLARRDPSDPISAIRDVVSAREAAVGRTMDLAAAKRDTATEIRTEMGDAASPPDAWADFIKSIECGE